MASKNASSSNTESFSDNNPNITHSKPPSSCPPPGAISNLCSATLGAGALSLPYAFSLTGLVLGVILLLLSGYLTILSIDVIITSCVKTRLFKYEDVAVRLAGRSAGRALEASLLVFCFGTAVAYIVAVGDVLDMGIRSVVDEDNGIMGIYSRELVMILFWLVVMFPLSLQRNMEGLERFSSLGVLSIIFLVLSSVIHSVEHGEILGKNDNASVDGEDEEQAQVDIRTMLWPASFWDVVQAFPIVIFAFSCQVNVCAIFEELAPKDSVSIRDCLAIKQRMMRRITRSGITLCITLYLAIGIFGYLDFAQRTLDNILKNYNIAVSHDSLMTAASIFVAVAIIVAYPFNILPARVTIKLIWDRFRATKAGVRCGLITRAFNKFRGYQRSHSSSNDEASNAPDNSNTTDLNTSNNSPPPMATFESADAMSSVNLTSYGVGEGLEPLLFGDEFEQSTHLPPMSLSNGGVESNATSLDSSGHTTSTLEHFTLTLFLSGSALIVALLIPGISVVFGLMGGTAASVISFILPGLFLRRMGDSPQNEDGNGITSGLKQNKRQKLVALCFIWGGVIIGVLSTGVTIYGLV